MITLAVHTGVAPHHWIDLGARGIATALDVLARSRGTATGPAAGGGSADDLGVVVDEQGRISG